MAPLLAGLLALGLFAGLLGSPLRPARRPHATLLVLGAAQWDGRPSPLFELRLLKAFAVYRGAQRSRRPVTRIVVSGGHGDGARRSEGRVGVEFLRSLGVPPSVLVTETHSHSTLENLLDSKPLLKGPVTLITDPIHAVQALALAKALGITADAEPSQLQASWLYLLRYRLRESLLLLAYALLGPRPPVGWIRS